MKTFVCWFLIFVFLMSSTACAGAAPQIADGMIIEVQTGAVARGIGSIANHTAFAAEVMESPGHAFYSFKWAIPQIGQAWTVFDGVTSTPITKFLTECGGKGNLCNAKTYAELKESLINNGWRVLPPLEATTLAKIVYTTLVAMTTREFVVPVVFAPVVDNTGEVDWARFFEDAVNQTMCPPLLGPDGKWFDLCALEPQT